MYSDDTFWQLSGIGQIGTFAITIVLGALMLWLCWRVTRREALWLRLVLALALFVLFDWLSPQVYYLWYMVVIPGLPLQWIAGFWPRPLAAAEVLAFLGPGSLSAHARALLGWSMIGIALLARGPRAEDPSGRTGPWVD